MSTAHTLPPAPPKVLNQDPDRIKGRRIAAGLSQQELADKAGVSNATVCKVENGDVSASARTLNLLADALGCEANDLLAPHLRAA